MIMKHILNYWMITFLLIVNYLIFAQVNNTKLTGQSFKGEVTISAAPKAIWSVLTDIKKLSEIGNFGYEGTPKKISKVGDSVPLKVFGDRGFYILTYSKPEAELRYTWEPDNASYICQERWLLAPSPNGTKVTFEDRYTESGPQTPEDISAQVKFYDEALAKLKTMVEKQSDGSD
jgi:hypothetical protein